MLQAIAQIITWSISSPTQMWFSHLSLKVSFHIGVLTGNLTILIAPINGFSLFSNSSLLPLILHMAPSLPAAMLTAPIWIVYVLLVSLHGRPAMILFVPLPYHEGMARLLSHRKDLEKVSWWDLWMSPAAIRSAKSSSNTHQAVDSG